MATLMTQTTQTQAPAVQSPVHDARPTLAQALDPSKALRLAPTLQPDVDLLTSEGLIAFGVKGSGKSNLLALLVEQLGRFLLPQLILDTEREYQSLVPLLPRGVLATASRCPSGADILHHGLQVVLDLQSWESDETAADAVCRLIDELFTTTNTLAPAERVPCVIHLDEAGYWLPQDAVTYLSKEMRKTLATAFHTLATRGRKQGLTLFLYTQSISEVAKSAIRQAGVKVLMRQTLDIDLTRYCQFIQGATPKTKKAIQAYPRGKAIVILPDGSQHRVQFFERESEHVSHTPQVQAALVKFAAMEVDVTALAMRDLTTVMPKAAPARMQPSSPSDTPASSLKARVYDLLAVNPALRVSDLMVRVDCGRTTAAEARRAYFAGHPELQSVSRTLTRQIDDLLSANPALHPVDLARLTGCSSKYASNVRVAYFVAHPEMASQAPDAQERIETLLVENPALSITELARGARCAKDTAYKWRDFYFREHPERFVPFAPTKRPHPVAQQLYDLLARQPTLSAEELMQATGCGQTTAFQARKIYFQQHPDVWVPLPPDKCHDPAFQRAYAALERDPSLRGAALMQAAACGHSTVSRARRAYFKKHPERVSQ